MKTLFEVMDTYSRHAYLYSAWTAMLIPCILASAMIFYYEPTSELQDFWKAATASIPVVVFLALGYFLRERVRATSKLLFQFPLFKEDESHMPTTDFLMWSSDYSDEMKRAIRNKVKKDFNYTMPSKEDEQKDEKAARKNIAAIVGSMRNKARESGDAVYTQANYRYGYNRNLLGGLVWSFIITAVLMILNFLIKSICYKWFIGALALIVIWGLVEFFVFYKYSARNYARQLFDTYLAIK
jgi:hypothetical protein